MLNGQNTDHKMKALENRKMVFETWDFFGAKDYRSEVLHNIFWIVSYSYEE